MDSIEQNTFFSINYRIVEVNGTAVVSCRSVEELARVASEATPAQLVLLRGAGAPDAPPPPAPAPINTFTQVRTTIIGLLQK